jgi:hypothetical protein
VAFSGIFLAITELAALPKPLTSAATSANQPKPAAIVGEERYIEKQTRSRKAENTSDSHSDTFHQ